MLISILEKFNLFCLTVAIDLITWVQAWRGKVHGCITPQRHCYCTSWTYCMVLSCHVRVSVNPQSIICLNVRELLARSMRIIWSLSNSSMIRTHNHLVHKRTPNHLGMEGTTLSYSCDAFLKHFPNK